MFPDNQNQSGGQPGYGPAQQPQVSAAPLQAPNGQYEVLPPLPSAQNNGHTGHNPYEFIVNPNAQKKTGLAFGGSFAKQLAVIVGGALVLLIVAAVGLSALKPKGITPDMTAIVQRQEEIVRIASAASTQATGTDTKNFAVTAALSVGTSEQQVLNYLVSHNVKLKAKDLALDYNSQTDTLLASAANAGTYDSAVVSNLSDQLTTYAGLLKKTYTKASSKATKELLQNNYSTASKLLSQADSITSGS